MTTIPDAIRRNEKTVDGTVKDPGVPLEDLVHSSAHDVKLEDGTVVKLNARQLRFVHHFVESMDEFESATLAGYNRERGPEVLRDPSVQQILLQRIAHKAKNSTVTLEKIEEMIWGIANGKIDGKEDADIGPKERLSALGMLQKARGGMAKNRGEEKTKLVFHFNLKDKSGGKIEQGKTLNKNPDTGIYE